MLRKRFATGFAPNHLMGLLPCILDKLDPTLAHLNNLARNAEAFSLKRLAANLTIDVISAVAIDEDFGAQHIDESRQGEFVGIICLGG